MASSQESSKMEEDGGRVTEGRPIHCINNCGFFGSVATMNLCSKCYRELNAKANTTSTFPTQTLTVAPAPAPAAELNTQPPPIFSPIKSNCPNLPNFHQDCVAILKEEGTSTASLAGPAFSPIKSDCLYLPHSTHNSGATLEVTDTSTATLVEPEAEMTKPLAKKRSNRCYSCNKRVGLTGFTCRCGDMFCALHRYSDKHVCTFDYKAAGRLAISKANPLVKAPKIDKI